MLVSAVVYAMTPGLSTPRAGARRVHCDQYVLDTRRSQRGFRSPAMFNVTPIAVQHHAVHGPTSRQSPRWRRRSPILADADRGRRPADASAVDFIVPLRGTAYRAYRR